MGHGGWQRRPRAARRRPDRTGTGQQQRRGQPEFGSLYELRTRKKSQSERKKKKTCDDWAELGKCDSTVKNESFTVSSVCEQSCNACPAAPTGCTNSAPGKKVKVKGKKKTCDDWAELGKCDSTVKNESFTVSSVCEQSCNACPA